MVGHTTLARDELDIVAADHRSTPTAIRDAVRTAVTAVAHNNHGLVSIANVRPLLPPWATGPQVGATICHLVRAGTLEPTGQFTESGDRRNRHGSRPVRVYRLVDGKAAA